MQALTLLAAALLVIGGINPDHFPPWTSFHAEAPAFAASAVLLAAGMAGPERLRLTPPVWLFLALAVLAWIQVATGLVSYAGDAWLVTAYLVAFAAAWAWGYRAGKSERPHQAIAIVGWTCIVIGLLATWQVLAQWMRIAAEFGGWVFSGVIQRPAGNFGQPNLTATMLLMASAAAAFFMVQRRLSRAAAWALLLVLGWGVVITQSRTALLSAAVMALLAGALVLRHPKLRAYRTDVLCWVVYLCLAVTVFTLVDWPFAGEARTSAEMTRIGGRSVIWRQVIAGILQSPWTGYGWLQVAAAQQAGALTVPGEDQVTFSHNAFLDLFAFVGIPLGVLLVAVLVAWLARRLLNLNAGNAAAAAGLLLLVPLLIHMQLELPHTYSYFLLPAGMLLGTFEAQTAPSRAWSLQMPRAAVAVTCAAWVALLAAIGMEYARVEEDFRVNRFENRRLGKTPQEYVVPELHLLTQWRETLYAMRLRAQPGMPAADLEVLARTSRRLSWAPLHYRAALAYALNGRPQQAASQMRLINAMFLPSVYAEGRADWHKLGMEKYPELRGVDIP